MSAAINYPDVFSYITDTSPVTVGSVQVALALRPRVLRAGRPFEVIMLIQNMTDVPADVTVKLHLPDKDADGKRGRFLAGTDRLVVGVTAAEVGYVTLPITTLPDTAVSKDYRAGMEISTKTIGRGQTIRSADSPRLNPQKLPSDRQRTIYALKELTFTNDRRGLLRGNVLEARFGVGPGKVGSMLDLKPGWVSLWTTADLTDVEGLLPRYRDTLRLRVIPGLHRNTILAPLTKRTDEVFAKGGYPLKPLEASIIARLLTLIVEHAGGPRVGHGSSDNPGIYDIRWTFKADRDDTQEPPELPHWVSGLLRHIARDERVSRVAHKAVPALVYHELLYDGVMHGFNIIERTTGDELGSDEEKEHYAQQIIQKLRRGGLTFTDVYMPLMMGGVLVYDQVLSEDEKLAEVLRDLRDILEDRRDERSEENSDIFDMTQRIVDQALKKYGMFDQ